MTKPRVANKLFDLMFMDAQSGIMAQDEEAPRSGWAWSSDNDMSDHPGLTLAHVSVRSGHIPNILEDNDDPAWAWKAFDGWSVRDAYNEYLSSKFPNDPTGTCVAE
jgi:hypothetical protein